MSDVQVDHEEEQLRRRIAELEAALADATTVAGAFAAMLTDVRREAAHWRDKRGLPVHLGPPGKNLAARTCVCWCCRVDRLLAARADNVPASFRCGVCGHIATPAPGLIEQLRASGGDGPYCTECHKAGRPDSLMRADVAGNGQWSTGAPRTT